MGGGGGGGGVAVGVGGGGVEFCRTCGGKTHVC